MKKAGTTSKKKEGTANKKKIASPAKKKSARARRPAATALSTADKGHLLKPRDGWETNVLDLLTGWRKHTRVLRVPGVTPARLGALVKGAVRAARAEKKLLDRYQQALRVRADARLRAGHEMWKATLTAWNVIKAAGDADPAVGASFASFAASLATHASGGGGNGNGGGGDAPPA